MRSMKSLLLASRMGARSGGGFGVGGAFIQRQQKHERFVWCEGGGGGVQRGSPSLAGVCQRAREGGVEGARVCV